MTRIIISHADGKRTVVDDGVPDPVAPPDEIAALRAEVERLKAGTVTVAKRTGMTQAEADALLTATKAKA